MIHVQFYIKIILLLEVGLSISQTLSCPHAVCHMLRSFLSLMSFYFLNVIHVT